jgi:site-specific recombinase XerD
MRAGGEGTHGRRLRGLIVVMWRAGLRIQQALALTEGDLDQRRGSLLVRRGKGGRHWSPASARAVLRRTVAAAGVRRRFAPHQFGHAHAVEMAREGVPLIVIQRQLGHSNLGITSVYLQRIDSGEIIETVHARRAPVVAVSALLRL